MKLSFIGCGNMGGAILDGILSSHLVNKEDISVCVSREESALRIKKEKGVFLKITSFFLYKIGKKRYNKAVC